LGNGSGWSFDDSVKEGFLALSEHFEREGVSVSRLRWEGLSDTSGSGFKIVATYRDVARVTEEKK
jgi:hypothetical protein